MEENLKSLNDKELLLKIKNLVGEEKKITGLVLEYLAEVESRRLYALRGYPYFGISWEIKIKTLMRNLLKS